ncbi:hypothetical protein [Nocardia brasiliensis]|uniref:hypothetical protein n=1 Tax=Nocardia brasiliensis TaxID=37326 RepID=UPI000A5032A0|nr:hypothetical protein [Nocardia brasiliensis]
MKLPGRQREWTPIRPVALLLAAAVCGGCGISGSAVFAGGDAPTGIAPGVTLYFVAADGTVTPEFRETGKLGTVGEALDLMRRTQPGPGLHTEIPEAEGGPAPLVTEFDTLITVDMPYTRTELSDHAIAQVACTALGVHRQAGRPSATVLIKPTIGPDFGSLTCPVQR